MLGKVLNGLRYRLINVFSCSTEDECSTCHNSIKQADYYTRIGEFKYCIECRPVKAIESPSSLKTDRIKNMMLQHKHRKVDAEMRAQLHVKELEEFRRNLPQEPDRERSTEPINVDNGCSENVRVFNISGFRPSQIWKLDTALISAYRETQRQKHS